MQDLGPSHLCYSCIHWTEWGFLDQTNGNTQTPWHSRGEYSMGFPGCACSPNCSCWGCSPAIRSELRLKPDTDFLQAASSLLVPYHDQQHYGRTVPRTWTHSAKNEASFKLAEIWTFSMCEGIRSSLCQGHPERSWGLFAQVLGVLQLQPPGTPTHQTAGTELPQYQFIWDKYSSQRIWNTCFFCFVLICFVFNERKVSDCLLQKTGDMLGWAR